MPVFNGAPFLAGAISAILRQSFGAFELLVVDDGSTDESPGIARSFHDPRIRIVENERNLGIVSTLNRGLAEAKTPWIARCDADDISHPQRLEKQYALALATPGAGFVGSHSRIVDARGRVRGFGRTASSHEAICWDLCFRNPFAHSSAFFLREGTEYLPVPAAEDYDLWSRIARSRRLASVSRALVDYRQHPDSIMAKHGSSTEGTKHRGILEIMEGNLQRFAGVDDASPDLKFLAEGWIEPPETREGIRAYWQTYGNLLARVPQQPDLRLVVSEHLFTKFCHYRKRNLAGIFLASLPATFLPKLPLFRSLFLLAIRHP
jgi:glycosyltransferase involved in cell wall biosynthesis